MEPPSKRQRLSSPELPGPTDDFDLQAARAQNDQKLKSIFEGIFEKYGRDFSDIGDEIDLRTGEIVVNKGHVLRMEHEDDTGESPGQKAIAQFTSGARERSQSVNSSEELSILLEAEDTLYESDNADLETTLGLSPDANVTAIPKHAALDNDNRPPSSTSIHQKSPPLSRAIDPLWQPPEISAKFWTPEKKETPKKTYVTPHKERPSSPPTAGSVWAIRTPGRPRASTQKKQITSSNKKPPKIGSKRKRKTKAILDWSFAQRSSDNSDSDDPLGEDAPPSSNRSIKIHGRNSVSQTPKAISPVAGNAVPPLSLSIHDDEAAEPEDTYNNISQTPKAMAPVVNNAIEPILIDDEASEPEDLYYDEVINETTPIAETPEVHSSSPEPTEDTPSRNNNTLEPILIHDDETAEPEDTLYDEVINETTSIAETPEVHSSSPAPIEDTPSRNRYVINFEWPTFMQPEEVILTPDEVKLIIKMKSQYLDIGWEEIVEHLPGRTLNDLLNWADHHLHLLDGTLKADGWSRGDLEKLDKLADESGIWWRDFQTLFPHRSRKEIESQAIQLWVKKHSEQHQQEEEEEEEDQEQEVVEVLPPKRKPSRTPYSDDNDPALMTGDVMTADDLDELLEEDLENDWSEISAIDAKTRTAEILNDTPRGEPRKSSVSPRKYY